MGEEDIVRRRGRVGLVFGDIGLGRHRPAARASPHPRPKVWPESGMNGPTRGCRGGPRRSCERYVDRRVGDLPVLADGRAFSPTVRSPARPRRTAATAAWRRSSVRRFRPGPGARRSGRSDLGHHRLGPVGVSASNRPAAWGGSANGSGRTRRSGVAVWDGRLLSETFSGTTDDLAINDVRSWEVGASTHL